MMGNFTASLSGMLFMPSPIAAMVPTRFPRFFGANRNTLNTEGSKIG
jgi:hypothetical protein